LDELEMVKFCKTIGMELVARSSTEIVIENNGEQRYEILQFFPFSSERKRTGILIRTPSEIVFYLKGADSMLKSMVSENSEWIFPYCDEFSNEGLRTLIFAKRVISEKEYTNFSQMFRAAKNAINDREELLARVISTLEHEMVALGVSGVSDFLQDDVITSIETLKSAKINIWMLTGDKRQTALSVAKSCNIISSTQLIFISRGSSVEQLEEELAYIEAQVITFHHSPTNSRSLFCL
jgi:phospholipid-translocating ATPase